MTSADRDAGLHGDAASDNAGDKLDARLLRIAAVFVLGSFMSILDSTIVNVAIKHLSRNFNSPLATIQWVSTGYILALATVIPVTGWAADRFGLALSTASAQNITQDMSFCSMLLLSLMQ